MYLLTRVYSITSKIIILVYNFPVHTYKALQAIVWLWHALVNKLYNEIFFQTVTLVYNCMTVPFRRWHTFSPCLPYVEKVITELHLPSYTLHPKKIAFPFLVSFYSPLFLIFSFLFNILRVILTELLCSLQDLNWPIPLPMCSQNL